MEQQQRVQAEGVPDQVAGPDFQRVSGWFTFHPATLSGPIHDSIRVEFSLLAARLFAQLPAGPDRTVALRKLQEAMWAANACVACNVDPGGAHMVRV